MTKGVIPLTLDEVIRVRKSMFEMKIGSREFGNDLPSTLRSCSLRWLARLPGTGTS